MISPESLRAIGERCKIVAPYDPRFTKVFESTEWAVNTAADEIEKLRGRLAISEELRAKAVAIATENIHLVDELFKKHLASTGLAAKLD